MTPERARQLADELETAHPECTTCLGYATDLRLAGDYFGPRHDGSKRCESGSIASGGERSHCTCDWCF